MPNKSRVGTPEWQRKGAFFMSRATGGGTRSLNIFHSVLDMQNIKENFSSSSIIRSRSSSVQQLRVGTLGLQLHQNGKRKMQGDAKGRLTGPPTNPSFAARISALSNILK